MNAQHVNIKQKAVIIISKNEIILLIRRKMKEYNDATIEYRLAMDNEISFSKEYWLQHDKYQAAFIKRSCLAELLDLIKEQ